MTRCRRIARSSPAPGATELPADIVYYLIFAAYIPFTIRTDAPAALTNDVTAEQIKEGAARLGGILLIIGVLHGLNLVIMPVLGRLFSLNRRFPPRGGGFD